MERADAVFLVTCIAVFAYIILVFIFSYKDFATLNTKNIMLKTTPGIVIIALIGMYFMRVFTWKQLAIILIIATLYYVIGNSTVLRAIHQKQFPDNQKTSEGGKEIPGESREEK